MLLLRPDDYPTEPYQDSTSLLDDPAALAARGHEQGFLYFRGLIPLDLVDALRAHARDVAASYQWVRPDPANPPTLRADERAYFKGHGWDDPRFVEMQHRVCFSPPFTRLVRHERVMRVLNIVMGEPAALATANHVWLKLPGSPEHTTRPHQDTYYLPNCPKMWTVWFPLVDTPLDVGPLGVVPGSHRDTWPHIDNMTGIDVPRDVGWVTGDVWPGDLVAFSASTIHCAWSNISPTDVRLSLDVRYEPAGLEQAVLKAHGDEVDGWLFGERGAGS